MKSIPYPALALLTTTIYILTQYFIWFHINDHNDLDLLKPQTRILEVTERPAFMYRNYLKTFKKNYNSKELKERFEIFKKSLKQITHLNRESGAIFNLTKFSDMKAEEIIPGIPNLGDCIPREQGCPPNRYKRPIVNGSNLGGIPQKFDWRDYGYVGPVLAQKQCNGCWAFSIVGVMETQAAIKNGKYGPRLSIQELIDCIPSPISNGCTSGSVSQALDWLCTNQWGVVTEEEYPLKLVTEPSCEVYHRPPPGAKLSYMSHHCSVQEDSILQWVYNHGPVIVVVYADPWLHYIDGVIQRACSADPNYAPLLHAVQIVGYDLTMETESVPYYIVRNSWGEDFGVDGYVKLVIGDNICGVSDRVSYLDV